MDTLLSQQEILRVLGWAYRADDESMIDGQDWLIVKRLAESVNLNPASVVPHYATDICIDPSTGYQFDPYWSPGG